MPWNACCERSAHGGGQGVEDEALRMATRPVPLLVLATLAQLEAVLARFGCGAPSACLRSDTVRYFCPELDIQIVHLNHMSCLTVLLSHPLRTASVTGSCMTMNVSTLVDLGAICRDHHSGIWGPVALTAVEKLYYGCRRAVTNVRPCETHRHVMTGSPGCLGATA